MIELFTPKEAKRALLAGVLPEELRVSGLLKLIDRPLVVSLPSDIRIKGYCIIKYCNGLADLSADEIQLLTGASDVVLGKDYPS